MAASAAFFILGGSVQASVIGDSGQDGLSAYEKYYTIKSPRIEEVYEVQVPANVLMPMPSVSGPLAEINEAVVVIDQIVNLGKKIWEIIEANKPVVKIATDTASALPAGLKTWENLAGWRPPASRLFHVSYENLYGMTVVNFNYRVFYTYGGNVNGKGHYLTQVTVVPADLSVSWGYTFGMTASVPSVTNSGTATDPVGAAQILLNWKVDTVLKHIENTQSYYVQGDGGFTDLSQQLN
jgi:hypothetical protein